MLLQAEECSSLFEEAVGALLGIEGLGYDEEREMHLTKRTLVSLKRREARGDEEARRVLAGAFCAVALGRAQDAPDELWLPPHTLMRRMVVGSGMRKAVQACCRGGREDEEGSSAAADAVPSDWKPISRHLVAAAISLIETLWMESPQMHRALVGLIQEYGPDDKTEKGRKCIQLLAEVMVRNAGSDADTSDKASVAIAKILDGKKQSFIQESLSTVVQSYMLAASNAGEDKDLGLSLSTLRLSVVRLVQAVGTPDQCRSMGGKLLPLLTKPVAEALESGVKGNRVEITSWPFLHKALLCSHVVAVGGDEKQISSSVSLLQSLASIRMQGGISPAHTLMCVEGMQVLSKESGFHVPDVPLLVLVLRQTLLGKHPNESTATRALKLLKSAVEVHRDSPGFLEMASLPAKELEDIANALPEGLVSQWRTRLMTVVRSWRELGNKILARRATLPFRTVVASS